MPRPNSKAKAAVATPRPMNTNEKSLCDISESEAALRRHPQPAFRVEHHPSILVTPGCPLRSAAGGRFAVYLGERDRVWSPNTSRASSPMPPNVPSLGRLDRKHDRLGICRGGELPSSSTYFCSTKIDRRASDSIASLTGGSRSLPPRPTARLPPRVKRLPQPPSCRSCRFSPSSRRIPTGIASDPRIAARFSRSTSSGGHRVDDVGRGRCPHRRG